MIGRRCRPPTPHRKEVHMEEQTLFIGSLLFVHVQVGYLTKCSIFYLNPRGLRSGIMSRAMFDVWGETLVSSLLAGGIRKKNWMQFENIGMNLVKKSTEFLFEV